jgi:hypothetical protein
MKLPASIEPEGITAIIDTREQCPLELSPLRVVRGTLDTGDYSIAGLEHVVSLEWKSLADLLACVGQERERFDREVQRLLAYPVRALLVEATWDEIEIGDLRPQVTAAAALGSVLGWIAAGLPVVMCGDHARAGRFASRLLFTAARRRWREARALISNLAEGAES